MNLSTIGAVGFRAKIERIVEVEYFSDPLDKFWSF